MDQDIYTKCKHKFNSQKCQIKIDPTRNKMITQQGNDTIKQLYKCDNAQQVFENIANTYSNNCEMTQKIYDYLSKGWIYPTTHAVRYAMGLSRGPIACFLFKFIELDKQEFYRKHNKEPTECDYILNDIEQIKTIIMLAMHEGGVSIDLSERRPHISDNQNGGITQLITSIRSIQEYSTPNHLKRQLTPIVFYLRVDHADILDFLELQQFRSDMYIADIFSKLQFGIIITDEFMNAVRNKQDIQLKDIKNNTIHKTVSAARIWIKILSLRHEKGNPFIFFIDNAIKSLNPALKRHVSTTAGPITNICTEIIQITGKDLEENIIQGVCCIVSLNLEKYNEWLNEPDFIHMVALFADNILEIFTANIENGSTEFQKATAGFLNGIKNSRPIAIGSFGWHGLLMKKEIPFNSKSAELLNHEIYKLIKEEAIKASQLIGKARGPSRYNKLIGSGERFTTLITCPPSTRAHSIFGSTPGINPLFSNFHTSKGSAGAHIKRNKHLDRYIRNKIHNELLIENIDIDSEKYTEEHNKRYLKIWNQIAANNGSIQELSSFSQEAKQVYKTAFEIDHISLIQHISDRQLYVDQAQSFNIYASENISKHQYHKIHNEAHIAGVKTMYYSYSTPEIDTNSNISEPILSTTMTNCESCD